MFMQIAARAAESDESYDMAASCAEKLAQDVEKCLKIRVDPELSNPCTTEGTSCTHVAGLKIDSSRISKHNQATGQKVLKSRRRLPKDQEDPLVALRKQLQRRKRTRMILLKYSRMPLQRYVIYSLFLIKPTAQQ
jgi:hypothetical protein